VSSSEPLTATSETLEVNFTLVRGTFALNFEFYCRPGISVITGASGSGKTSLLDCVSGLLSPNKGSIKFGDKVFFDAEKRMNLPPQQRQVGYVLQRPSLFPHMTVRENIEYAFQKNIPSSVMATRVDELSIEFGIDNLLKRQPGQISGGQAQRVALVRAIAAEPLLFLFDEPLSSLDEQSRTEMVTAIKKVRTVTHKSILYVTHSSSEADELADYRIAGSNGEFRALAPT
jgi:molybdate transport system ATP-binding protein